jgi:hypothetical protein
VRQVGYLLELYRDAWPPEYKKSMVNRQKIVYTLVFLANVLALTDTLSKHIKECEISINRTTENSNGEVFLFEPPYADEFNVPYICINYRRLNCTRQHATHSQHRIDF